MNPTTPRNNGIRTLVRIIACLWCVLAHISAGAQDSPHGALSIACDRCHTSASWTRLRARIGFDHASTGFALQGQHQAASCRACHATLRFAGAPNRCAECHSDIHRGELGNACDRCHTPESWLVPDMPIRHAQTRFPLLGTHATVPCQECHVNQQKNEFVRVQTECYGCHRADYVATLAPAHAPAGFGLDCTPCHAVTSPRWAGGFDHGTSAFPLTGAHLAVPCNSCHAGGRFKGTATECAACHLTGYTATTNPPHASSGFSTDCRPCHSTIAWAPAMFDHAAFYLLTGAHTTVSCNECHPGNRYTGTPATCYGCHTADYAGAANPEHASAGFPTDCTPCHSTTAWTPSSFSHEQYFPISSGSHGPGRWSACTDCHNVPGSIKAFTCLTCHEHAQTTMDSKHSGVSRYQYDSQACFNCHPRGRAG